MKRLIRPVGLFLVVLAGGIAGGSAAWGWSGPGHAAIAALAYQELPQDQRQRLIDVLRGHPNFAQWQGDFDKSKAKLPAKLDFGTYLFIRASTWPDEIRRKGISRFDHPDWHFVDYPVQQSDWSAGSEEPKPHDDVLFGIAESRRVLADPQAAPDARAASLSWLLHLLGDLHQPLHCASLVNATTFRAPKGDEGGNLFFISVPGRRVAVKLHSFWDQQLGDASPPDPKTAFNDALRLAGEHPRSALAQLTTATDVLAWSLESRDAAVEHVYRYGKTSHGQTTTVPLRGSADDRKAPPLPSGYRTQAKAVARERIALAGYRLADLLQALTPAPQP